MRIMNRNTLCRRLAGTALLLGVLQGAVASAEAAQAAPGVGDPAPEFSLPGSDGRTWTLSDLRGQWVVVAFFPKAFTGG